MKKIALLLASLITTGCGHHQRHPFAQQIPANPLELKQAIADDKYCWKIGALPNSDAYRDCRAQLQTQHDAEREIRMQKALKDLLDDNPAPQRTAVFID